MYDAKKLLADVAQMVEQQKPRAASDDAIAPEALVPLAILHVVAFA